MQKYELLLAPIISWFVAQGIKFIVTLRRDGIQWKDLYASGDFPSAHTACIVSVTSLVGLRNGVESTEFAILFVVAALVMYDSVGVRRTVGEHGSAIKELAAKSSNKLATQLHMAKGHTPSEVMGGIFVGFIVGFSLYIFV